MLVLSRKKNEAIVINNDITIVVVEIRGDKVRLGVEAPKEVPVHRREVYDAIQRSQAAEDGVTAVATSSVENLEQSIGRTQRPTTEPPASGYGWIEMSGTSMDTNAKPSGIGWGSGNPPKSDGAASVQE